VVAALAEFTIVPYLKTEATPHPVLVFGVIWAIAGGLEAGLVWAFVGGLALDILGPRPLGSSAFSLLIAWRRVRDRRAARPGEIVAPSCHLDRVRSSACPLAATTASRPASLARCWGVILSVYDALAAILRPGVAIVRRRDETIDW
jgi:hypothetical protein